MLLASGVVLVRKIRAGFFEWEVRWTARWVSFGEKFY